MKIKIMDLEYVHEVLLIIMVVVFAGCLVLFAVDLAEYYEDHKELLRMKIEPDYPLGARID